MDASAAASTSDADVADSRIVLRGAEIRLDEHRGGSRPSLGEDAGDRGVRPDFGVSVLDEQRGEACQVAACLDDPDRDLRGLLERVPKRLVAVALRHLLPPAQDRQRIPVDLGVRLRERRHAGPERLRLPDRPAGFRPVILRGARDHRDEPGGHGDGDRRGRASAGRPFAARGCR